MSLNPSYRTIRNMLPLDRLELPHWYKYFMTYIGVAEGDYVFDMMPNSLLDQLVFRDDNRKFYRVRSGELLYASMDIVTHVAAVLVARMNVFLKVKTLFDSHGIDVDFNEVYAILTVYSQKSDRHSPFMGLKHAEPAPFEPNLRNFKHEWPISERSLTYDRPSAEV